MKYHQESRVSQSTMCKEPGGDREEYIAELQKVNRHNSLLYHLLPPAKLRRRQDPEVIFACLISQNILVTFPSNLLCFSCWGENINWLASHFSTVGNCFIMIIYQTRHDWEWFRSVIEVKVSIELETDFMWFNLTSVFCVPEPLHELLNPFQYAFVWIRHVYVFILCVYVGQH